VAGLLFYPTKQKSNFSDRICAKGIAWQGDMKTLTGSLNWYLITGCSSMRRDGRSPCQTATGFSVASQRNPKKLPFLPDMWSHRVAYLALYRVAD
jgi:hypothetical protein